MTRKRFGKISGKTSEKTSEKTLEKTSEKTSEKISGKNFRERDLALLILYLVIKMWKIPPRPNNTPPFFKFLTINTPLPGNILLENHVNYMLFRLEKALLEKIQN